MVNINWFTAQRGDGCTNFRAAGIKAEPTTENVERLKEVEKQADAVVEDLMAKTGGVGLGLPKRDFADDPKIEVTGTHHFFKANEDKGPGRGYRIVKLNAVPEGTIDSKGQHIISGDLVGFPTGSREPAVNSDATEKFLLPTDKGKPKFTKVAPKRLSATFSFRLISP